MSDEKSVGGLVQTAQVTGESGSLTESAADTRGGPKAPAVRVSEKCERYGTISVHALQVQSSKSSAKRGKSHGSATTSWSWKAVMLPTS